MTYFPACERITIPTRYGWRLDVLQFKMLATTLFPTCLLETCQKSASTVAILQYCNSLKQKLIKHNFFPFLNSHAYIAKWKNHNIDITCQMLVLFNKSWTFQNKLSQVSIAGWSWWVSTCSCHFCVIAAKRRCVILEYIYNIYICALHEVPCWSRWHWATVAGRRLSSPLLHQHKSERKGKEKIQKARESYGTKKGRCKMFYWLPRWQDGVYSSGFE